MVDKLKEQAEEIQAICSRLGINPVELGAAAGIALETMRKYAKGYQPASQIAMASLRNVEKFRLLLREGTASPKKTDSGRSHSFIETQTLGRMLQDLSGRLANAAPAERKHILGNIRDVLDELEERELKGAAPAAKTATLEESQIDQAARAIDKLGMKALEEHKPAEYRKTGKAVSKSENTSAPK